MNLRDYELNHKTTWELYRRVKNNPERLVLLSELHWAYVELAKRKRWVKYERLNSVGWKVFRVTDKGLRAIFKNHRKDLRRSQTAK